MIGSSSVNKVARVARKRQLRNRFVRHSTRTRVKEVRRLISAGKLDLAQQEAVTAISSIDKAVSKGVFHKNKGARLKSRLVKKLNAAVVTARSLDSERSEEKEEQS